MTFYTVYLHTQSLVLGARLKLREIFCQFLTKSQTFCLFWGILCFVIMERASQQKTFGGHYEASNKVNNRSCRANGIYGTDPLAVSIGGGERLLDIDREWYGIGAYLFRERSGNGVGAVLRLRKGRRNALYTGRRVLWFLLYKSRRLWALKRQNMEKPLYILSKMWYNI